MALTHRTILVVHLLHTGYAQRALTEVVRNRLNDRMTLNDTVISHLSTAIIIC